MNINREEREMLDISGLQMAARYAAYCPMVKKSDCSKDLVSFAISGDRSMVKTVEVILVRLMFLPFIDKITEENEIVDVFDPRVISFFWKGWPHLDGQTHNHEDIFAIEMLPIEHIDTDILNADWVHPAQVIDATKAINVKYRPIIKAGKKLELGHVTRPMLPKNDLVRNVKDGDFVAIHSSQVVEIISSEEFENLSRINESILKEFNASREAKGIG